MATMIPSGVEEFRTEGEKRFYRFLETVAKPDGGYLSWYLPDIQGKEPDFLLFADDIGLIIFEVKDWSLDQIKEANPHYFVIDINGTAEKRKNPLYQTREYFGSVIDMIKDDGYLVSHEPYAKGNPKIPINTGIVFPNINKYEYCQKGMEKVIDCGRIFFWDDLHPQSDICRDRKGQRFLQALKTMFSPQFAFKVSGKEIQHLKQLIFPVVRIELPDRCASDRRRDDERRLKILDHNQEAIARKYESGHRIIIGPSGSGKTLILVHKAAFLRQYNPAIRSILFVCFNITLVNYIKRLFANKKIPIGKDGVEVMHFYRLCSDILDERVVYEKEDADYYRLVVQETLSKVASFPQRYDAILVDEGQDFSDDMYRVVTSLLNPQTNNLTIALDDNQNLYRPQQSWKDLGIQVQGRVHRINNVYRNTSEIADFASRFAGLLPPAVESERMTGQCELFPDFFDYHGPVPELVQRAELDEATAYVAETISDLIKKEDYPLSEFAVLYARTFSDSEGNRQVSYPAAITKALEKRGLVCQWASEDYRAKKAYDVTTNSITVSTIHSAKGFDYACVFIVGLDQPGKEEWTEDQLKNLAYVGITRARERLFILYSQKTSLIEKLSACIVVPEETKP